MGNLLRPEEKEALLARDACGATSRAAAAPVIQRDFGQPRLLTAGTLEDLVRSIEPVLPRIEAELRQLLGSAASLALGGIEEQHAGRLRSLWNPPFALARFESRAQLGWISWQPVAAVAAIETILGMPPGAKERALSSVERAIFLRIVRALVQPLAALLGFELGNLRAVLEADEIGSWDHGGSGAHPHRLSVSFAIEGPGGRSTLFLHLPGWQEKCRPATTAPAAARLVPHLSEVPIDLSARLGSAELCLSDVLALEVGDVVPLSTRLTEPLELWAGERRYAAAGMGARGGRVCVELIETVEPEPED